MKRFTPIVIIVLLVIPVVLYAQDRQTRETRLLHQVGLTNDQITQVQNLQNKLRETVRQDLAYVRLIRAQIGVALLPANPDMQKVDNLVDQASRRRADMQKAAISASVELRRIVGEANFQKIEQLLHQRWGFDRARFRQQFSLHQQGKRQYLAPRPQMDNPAQPQQ